MLWCNPIIIIIIVIRIDDDDDGDNTTHNFIQKLSINRINLKCPQLQVLKTREMIIHSV